MSGTFAKRNKLFKFQGSGSIELPFERSRQLALTLKGDVTVNRFTGGVDGEELRLFVYQDDIGSRTINWPASVTWVGGVAPTLSSGVGELSLLTFWNVDEGYVGTAVGAGASLVDGDYEAFTVSSGVAVLADGSVDSDAIAADSIQTSHIQDAESVTLVELQDELGVPNTSGKVSELRLVGTLANGTFKLDIKAIFPYTITSLIGEGGEAFNATVKIGATTVTGLNGVALTTSAAAFTATAANSVVVDDVVTCILTNIATTTDVNIKVVVTRG
jgi:hypothetical protein